MSDDNTRRKAEEVVWKWKCTLDVSRLPKDIPVSNEDELVDLIETALRSEK